MQAESSSDLHVACWQVVINTTQPRFDHAQWSISHFSNISCKHVEQKQSKVAQKIEEGIKAVRVEVSKVTDVYDTQKSNLDRYYVNAMKDTQHIRNYLQEEDNTLPRVGAIAVGSLAGVVLGVRGGFFRKIFYASVTGSAVASICYPRDAKKYATVVYNFAYGIKPGDERQKDLPKFPTTLGEFKDNVVSLSSLAYDAVFNSKK